MTNEMDETEERASCPFCGVAYECEHQLLRVDVTFRWAEAGILDDAFNSRWTGLCEEGGDDLDEGAAFEMLLDEFKAVADGEREFDFDAGAPGMSSNYVAFYVSSKAKAKKLAAQFKITD